MTTEEKILLKKRISQYICIYLITSRIYSKQSVEDIAKMLNINIDTYKKYEAGEDSIPCNQLYLLLQSSKLNYFLFFKGFHDLQKNIIDLS